MAAKDHEDAEAEGFDEIFRPMVAEGGEHFG
jgi:hypothetical protein